MSPKNRKANETQQLARAQEALESAELLLRAGKWADATSRAYYAAFHAAQALLFHIGRQAKTHAGVRNLLGQHYVTPGVLPAEVARLLSALAKSREDADYEAALAFTEEMARGDVEAARQFLEQAREILE